MQPIILVSDLSNKGNGYQLAVKALKDNPKFYQAVFTFYSADQAADYINWVKANLPRAIIAEGEPNIVSVSR